MYECKKGFWEEVILNWTNPKYMLHSYLMAFSVIWKIYDIVYASTSTMDCD